MKPSIITRPNLLYRRTTDAFMKEFTVYDIVVKHGLLEWKLSRRYSEFASLQVSVMSRSCSHAGCMLNICLAYDHSFMRAGSIGGGGYSQEASPAEAASKGDQVVLGESPLLGTVGSRAHSSSHGPLLMQEEVIKERQRRLEGYLQAVVRVEEAMQNVAVLAFLGMVNTAKQELPQMAAKDSQDKPRQVGQRDD
jgi:hypothetical protein